jgi:hypothetical protein
MNYNRQRGMLRMDSVKEMRKNILMRICAVVNKPALVYSSECWTEEGRSEAVRMRFLRPLGRVIRWDHAWNENFRYQLGEEGIIHETGK